MSLTEIKIKSAKPKDKKYKLFDSEGLFLLVNPNGSKYWRLKYRYNDRENTYAIGVYPDCSLAQARDKKNAVKSQLKEGINPNNKRKLIELEEKIQAGNVFKSVALEWHSKNERKCVARTYFITWQFTRVSHLCGTFFL